MVMILLNVLVLIGEIVMEYNYVRTRYGWEVTEFSLYSGICSGAALVGKMYLSISLKNTNCNIDIFRSSYSNSIDSIHGAI